MTKIGAVGLRQSAPAFYETVVTTSGSFDIDRSFRFIGYVREHKMPDASVSGYSVARLDLNNFWTETASTAKGDQWAPDISADGRAITYKAAQNFGGSYTTWRKDFTTGALIELSSGGPGVEDHTSGSTKGANGVVVARGGLFNAAITPQGEAYSIAVTNTRTGEAFVMPSAAVAGVDSKPFVQAVSPDGRFVLYWDYESGFSGDESVLNVLDTLRYTTRQAAKEGRDVVLDVATTDAKKVAISWGDGTSVTETSGGGETTLMHGYKADGTYVLTVKAIGATTAIQSRTVIIDTTFADGETQQTISGTSAHNIILGSNISDVVTLGGGNDVARTRVGDDKIFGGSGADTLIGGVGNDTLIGGAARDSLSGGSGKDIFVFDVRPSSSNIDKILDFSAIDDTIYLKGSIFKKLGKGSELDPNNLAKAFFTIGEKPKDSNDFLIYNNKTVSLMYDADGWGAGKAVEILSFKKGLKLSYNDFCII